MKDQFNREISYMRISVTDRCNERCVYCMPAEGVAPVLHEEILRFDEILKIAEAAAACGIRHLRVTGGEPLVRRGVVKLVELLGTIPGIESVSLTTNGILLGKYADDLYKAGVRAFNISLDTMDEGLYERLTRGGNLADVLEGIRAVRAYPDTTVKLDAVILGIREQKLWDVASFSKEQDIHVRFIEMMPIGLGRSWLSKREQDLMADDVKMMLSERFGQPMESPARPGLGPASYVHFPGFKGLTGFIPAVSHKFCGECSRIRLSSQGFLKTCLQFDAGTDLKGLIRGGCSGDALREAVAETIWRKPACHSFGQGLPEGEARVSMSAIGG